VRSVFVPHSSTTTKSAAARSLTRWRHRSRVASSRSVAPSDFFSRPADLDPTACRDAGEAWPLPERRRLAQLLRDPLIGGVPRDAEVDDPAGAEFDDEERVGRPEEQVRNRQEVASPGLARAVAQERRPALPGWARPWHLPQILLDGPLAHPDVELQEFAPDPLGTPERIVARHCLDTGHVGLRPGRNSESITPD
jgi:hypothetical protein